MADSTILLSCPRIPLFQGTLCGVGVADELQELQECTMAFIPDRGILTTGGRRGSLCTEGVFCAQRGPAQTQKKDRMRSLESILHFNQEKCISRNGAAGGAAVFLGKHLGDPFGFLFAHSYFEE